MIPFSFEPSERRAKIKMQLAQAEYRTSLERNASRQPDDPGPFHLDLGHIDAARDRACWRMALVCLICAAMITAALAGPVIIHQWDRIEAAVCAGESVV